MGTEMPQNPTNIVDIVPTMLTIYDPRNTLQANIDNLILYSLLNTRMASKLIWKECHLKLWFQHIL